MSRSPFNSSTNQSRPSAAVSRCACCLSPASGQCALFFSKWCLCGGRRIDSLSPLFLCLTGGHPSPPLLCWARHCRIITEAKGRQLVSREKSQVNHLEPATNKHIYLLIYRTGMKLVNSESFISSMFPQEGGGETKTSWWNTGDEQWRYASSCDAADAPQTSLLDAGFHFL